MRLVALVQARMGSSRLPGKSLQAIDGRPLIAHVLERVAAVPDVETVVLATTRAAVDDGLAVTGRALGAEVYRGHETDVLDRMHAAAQAHAATAVLRVTGDCPLWAPDVACEVVQQWLAAPDAYVWTDTAGPSGYPDGTDVEVCSVAWLTQAWRLATLASDREHVTRWIRRQAPVRVVVNALSDDTDLKLSVDTAADLAFVRQVHARLPAGRWDLAATVTAARAALREDRR